jgi:DNA invertase Pin-like site-specific DNA recombinase
MLGSEMSELWAGIVRVSHVGTRGGDSLHADEEQVHEIDRYAAAVGARVEFMPPEMSVSGGRPIAERPSLQAAIEGVERGDYAGIVVAYLSRLSRSRSGLQIWERVERAGGRVHCAHEKLDTSTPNGRFIRDIHLANAVREREEHAERHDQRRRATVAAGIWRQHQTPRGYRFRGPAGEAGRFRGAARRLVPDDQADEVARAFRDRQAGTSMLELAGRLGMTPSGVRALLRNRVYLGELRDGDYVNPRAHAAIVDAPTFEAVQGARSRPPRSARGTALLAGLIRCSACGHVMSRRRAASVVYGCPTHHSGARCPSPAFVTASLVEAHVERIALAELDRVAVTAGEGQWLQRAQQRVEEAEAELRDYLRMVNLAGIDVRVAAEAARERQQAVEAARDALRAERARSAVVPAGGSGRDVWPTLCADEKNALLRSLLSGVIVARAGGRGARTPLRDRVRVLAKGAAVRLPERRRGRALGIVPIALADLDGPDVLGMPSGEDRA